MSRALGPDFFIVGAPKCGTTSLNAYLGAHPAIFMAKKEQHFFGTDLAEVWSQPSPEEYFGSFAGSEWATRRGEASGWYLRSHLAAKEIRAYNPQARIIAILRNPVDMLASYHSQCLWRGWESIEDFGEAIAAEDDRRGGYRIPSMNRGNPWRLLYRDAVRFHEQIERYFAAFGRDQVCVLLLDDLVQRPAETYKSLLRFLSVESTFTPAFPVMNPNKYSRSQAVRRAVDVLWDPSPRMRRIGRRLIPAHAARHALFTHVVSPARRMNTSVMPRPPVDPQLRLRLAAEFAPDIDSLGALLGRDLTHWYVPAGIGATGESAEAAA